MERPGEKLKRARERLSLTFREVEEASQQIARRRGSDEFSIALSRLADIENKGTVPSIYRIYSLCAIYCLDLDEVLQWYGVPRDLLASESAQIGLAATHPVQFAADSRVTVPLPADIEVDLNQTTFLSHIVRRWGKMSLSFLNGLEPRQYRYGFIGMEDWSMHPILPPGAFVAIDDGRRRIVNEGWTSELERPIYFLERRDGFMCGWCSVIGGKLVVQPHPSSDQKVAIFELQREIDVIGQVVGVAMPLDARRRRRVRSGATPSTSPDR
jgi:transcriptional regulator with XRE-family HTH domain